MERRVFEDSVVLLRLPRGVAYRGLRWKPDKCFVVRCSDKGFNCNLTTEVP